MPQTKIRLIFFLNNSNLHGLRYLGARCSLPGKIIWCFIIFLSIWLMLHLFKSTYVRYNTESVGMIYDINHLQWINTFPAVSLCLENIELHKMIKQFLIENPSKEMENINLMKYSKFIQKYLYINPNDYLLEFPLCKQFNETCGINVAVLQELFFIKNCSEFMYNVNFMGYSNGVAEWDGRCEQLFKLKKTEIGYCFMANSIYSSDLTYDELPLKYPYGPIKRTLSFEYLKSNTTILKIYVHSPEEIPNIYIEPYEIRPSSSSSSSSLEQISLNSFIIHVNTFETVNSMDIQTSEIGIRKCRYPNENQKKNSLTYSFLSCATIERIQIELKYCNCTIHTSPPDEYKNLYCNYNGLICIRKLKSAKLAKELILKYKSNCLQSCISMEIVNVGFVQEQDLTISNLTNHIKISININNTPTSRYLRKLTQTNFDLIIAIGSEMCLFFGASILSVIEMIYIIFIRKF